MPGATETFKIFVAKLNINTQSHELRELFEKYGKVVECDVVKNYGFVHMENEEDGKRAIENLNDMLFNGSKIRVEASRKRKSNNSGQPTTKIYVGNLPNGIRPAEVTELFSQYGSVMECDLIQNYGFVHIDTNDLTKLLNEVNGLEFRGQRLKVQISTSRVRPRPGMGSQESCYKCGRTGHWSKECPKFGPTIRPDPMAAAHAQDLYGRSMYPPTSASYLRDRMFSYAAYKDMYERYLEQALTTRFDDISSRTTSSRRSDLVGTERDVEYDAYGRHSPSSTRYPLPASNSRTVYDEYGRQTDAMTAAMDPYFYDDKRAYGYDAAALAKPALDPYKSRNTYSDDLVDRRDGDRSATRYAPY